MVEQTGDGDRDVVAVGDRPQARAVPVDEDGSPLPHPRDVGPAAEGRQCALVVCVRRADDRHREPALAVRLHQQVLAGDLVAGVLPEGVPQRSGLRDRKPRGRRLVGRRGADEDVLVAPSLEQLHVGAHLVRCEGQELGDDVEATPRHGRADGVAVTHIRVQALDVLRDRAAAEPAIHHRHPVSDGHCGPHARRADDPGPADEEDARHRPTLTRRPPRAGRRRASTKPGTAQWVSSASISVRSPDHRVWKVPSLSMRL